jgi:uncharacterized protein involved in outer membrane biogenesis
MRKRNKVIIWIIGTIACLFILLNAALPLFAKRIIIQQIEENLSVKASLYRVSITPPLSVNLIKLKIGDIFEADRVSVSPSLLGLLVGKLVFSSVEIINPVIVINQSKEGRLNIPQPKQSNASPPRVYLTALAVRNGKLVFSDEKISSPAFKTVLERINADISKVAFPPQSLKTNFKVSLDFSREQGGRIGSALFSGWLDWFPKNMDASLKIDNLDITYFSPYYGDFISSRELLSAKLNTNTAFKSSNNALSVFTNFRLSDIAYAKKDDLSPPSINLVQNALDFFTDPHGNLDLDFEIDTRMDSPGITIPQLQKLILKAAAKNLARQDPQDLIEKISDNIEQFKSFGKYLKKEFKGEE